MEILIPFVSICALTADLPCVLVEDELTKVTTIEECHARKDNLIIVGAEMIVASHPDLDTRVTQFKWKVHCVPVTQKEKFLKDHGSEEIKIQKPGLDL